jgi:uncharacterized protein DUF4760
MLAYAPLLIAVGSLITATMSFLSFRHTRHAAVRSETVSLIMRMTSDAHVSGMLDRFRSLRLSLEAQDRANPSLDVLRRHTFVWSAAPWDSTRVVKDMFNFYEAMALGVSAGWLDEAILKSYWRSSYVLDFDDFRQYVDDMRSDELGGPKLYLAYEALVQKWRGEST